MPRPPAHRRPRDPFRKAQRAPQIRQAGPSPLKAEMLHARTPGQTRQVDGRWEMWDPSVPPGGWVCAEPVDNAPEGMCGMPVEDAPCPVHHPGEET